jgi:membrane protease YdiL (CAAX protease family)
VRKQWKEVGLGALILLAVIAAVAACQPLYRKVLPMDLGPVAIALNVLLVYLAAARWIERRFVPEFARGRALPELTVGLLTGFALFSATMAIFWAMGVYHPTGWGSTKGIATAFALAMMAGFLEEILFRGLLLRLSSRIVGTWGALLFTSSLFGLAHLANKGAHAR